jgi:hypothetical protein
MRVRRRGNLNLKFSLASWASSTAAAGVPGPPTHLESESWHPGWNHSYWFVPSTYRSTVYEPCYDTMNTQAVCKCHWQCLWLSSCQCHHHDTCNCQYRDILKRPKIKTWSSESYRVTVYTSLRMKICTEHEHSMCFATVSSLPNSVLVTALSCTQVECLYSVCHNFKDSESMLKVCTFSSFNRSSTVSGCTEYILFSFELVRAAAGLCRLAWKRHSGRFSKSIKSIWNFALLWHHSFALLWYHSSNYDIIVNIIPMISYEQVWYWP